MYGSGKWGVGVVEANADVVMLLVDKQCNPE